MSADFFLKCAGTSEELLDQCHEDDLIRQQQLGAHVFFTAFLAFFSSWFALGYVFGDDIALKSVFAFLWAMTIFLLDRTLIVAPVLVYDRKNQLRTAWYGFAIRLAIALLLGLFIATPFELRLFVQEIENHIKESAHTIKKSDINSKYDAKKLALEAVRPEKIKTLEKEIIEKNKALEKAKTDREYEYKHGSPGTVPGAGSRWKQLTTEIGLAESYINIKTEELKRINNEYATTLEKIESERAEELEAFKDRANDKKQIEIDAATARTSSLLTRLKVFAELQAKDPNVKTPAVIVLLTFIIFEIIPIIAKLLFKGSQYDLLILEEKRKAVADNQEALADAVEREERAKARILEAQSNTRTQEKINKQVEEESLYFSDEMLRNFKEEYDDIMKYWRENRTPPNGEYGNHLNEVLRNIVMYNVNSLNGQLKKNNTESRDDFPQPKAAKGVWLKKWFDKLIDYIMEKIIDKYLCKINPVFPA